MWPDFWKMAGLQIYQSRSRNPVQPYGKHWWHELMLLCIVSLIDDTVTGVCCCRQIATSEWEYTVNTDMTSCDTTPSVSANELSENEAGGDSARHSTQPVSVYTTIFPNFFFRLLFYWKALWPKHIRHCPRDALPILYLFHFVTHCNAFVIQSRITIHTATSSWHLGSVV